MLGGVLADPLPPLVHQRGQLSEILADLRVSGFRHSAGPSPARPWRHGVHRPPHPGVDHRRECPWRQPDHGTERLPAIPGPGPHRPTRPNASSGTAIAPSASQARHRLSSRYPPALTTHLGRPRRGERPEDAQARLRGGRIGDGWTPRELRTSFVSLMSHRGVSIEETARLVGHASTRTTEVVYRRELRPVITTGAEITPRPPCTGRLQHRPRAGRQGRR
jgi:integrase